jgi:hypothetical protein
MPRILLHLGLPKTATSSLQHNVFQKLHEEGRINFLGKCLDYDYQTGKVVVTNYSGQFIRDAAEGKLELEDARQKLEDALCPDCLNVFSDEGLMVAYPGKGNLPLAEKFENMARLLRGYDVQIVVTLRDPIDYLYSLYVQLYPDFFSKIKSLNSTDKYVESIFANPEDVLFESLFFSRWLPNLKEKFSVTVFQYENIGAASQSIEKQWESLLDLSPGEFAKYFSSKKLNVKNKSGNEVEKVADLKVIEDMVLKISKRNSTLFLVLKYFYNASGLKYLINYRFSVGSVHCYPSGEKYSRLRKLLVD